MTIEPKEIYALLISRNQKALLEYFNQGLNFNIADENGNTALHLAAIDGNIEVARSLILNYFADANLVNDQGFNPLQLAFINNHFTLAQVLINLGSDIAAILALGYSPLHLVAIHSGFGSIRLLLEQPDIDIYQQSSAGLTAFHYAAKAKNFDAYYRLIYRVGISNIPLPLIIDLMQIVAENGEQEFVSPLFFGDSINRQDELGRSILHLIANFNHNERNSNYIVDTLRTLISHHGANPNLLDNLGDTPLCHAIRKGNTKAVKFLLKASTISDINRIISVAIEIANQEILNILLEHEAANGNFESVSTLFQHNADINSTNAEGYSPLHLAIENGHNRVVDFLLNNQANISNYSRHGYTALQLAARSQNNEAISMLLEREHNDIYQNSPEGYTAFHYAVRTGNIPNIMPFIDNQVNVNHLAQNGDSALHIALSSRASNEVISYLLENQADPNLLSSSGFSALDLALRNNNHQALYMLLSRGANVNQINRMTETPMHTALRTRNIESIRILSEFGADVRIRNAKGHNAFHFAAMNGNVEAFQILERNLNHIPANTAEEIENLRSTSINARSVQGITPFHAAVQRRQLDMIRYLLNNGASIPETDIYQRNVIHYASDDVDTLELLLSFGRVELDTEDENGITPLFNAICKKNINAVKLLIKAGANVNFINKKNNTALNYALENRNYEIVELLLQNGADANHLNGNGNILIRLIESLRFSFLSEESFYLSLLQLLFDHGANLSSALVYGIQTNNIHSVRHLLERIGSLTITGNINELDQNGFTPLHIAVHTENINFVQMLLEHGADPNIPDFAGNLPSELAHAINNQHIAEMLERYSALFNHENNLIPIESSEANDELITALRDLQLTNTRENLDMPDRDGNTPLHIATQVEAISLIRMLLENGANPNLANRYGDRPLSLARDNNEITQLLLEYGANDGIIGEDHSRSQAILTDGNRSEGEETDDEVSNYSIGGEEFKEGEYDGEDEEEQDSRVIHFSDGNPLKKHSNDDDEAGPSGTGKVDSSILNLITNSGTASLSNSGNANQDGKNPQGQANDSSDSLNETFYNFLTYQAPLFTLLATSFVMYNYGSSFLGVESSLDSLLCGAVKSITNGNLIEAYETAF